MKVKSDVAEAMCKSLGVKRVVFEGEPLLGETPGFHIYTIDGYYEHLTEKEFLNQNKNSK